MAFQPDRPIKIELMIQAAQPALLEGLDVWLRLGLLSDSQVKRLCRERLVCPLPQAIVAETVPTPSRTPLGETSLALQASAISPVVPPDPETALTAKRQPPNFVTSIVQSFMAEISVIWLLFLGVFMVVVSSGVLAASQWQHFPPTEQYGILFGYTLAFWGASAWTSRQQSLHLTARMLQITTLLIVPVNFWMIDGFKLWSSGSGRVVAAIAALVLTAITIILLKPTSTRSTGVRLTINSVCLSWLHWGWGWAGFPLIATYLGTVGTALVLYQQSILSVAAREEEREDGLPLGIIAVTLATLLLIARAVFVAHVPIHQLGLALGICGWLLCWLSRRNPARKLWTRAGAVLLLVGRFVTVTAVTPWQATAVNGLGAWLLADRLLRLQQVQDLTALFLVGLQTCWLLWRTIPTELQQRLIAFCISIAGTTFMPWALVGVALFPYVVLTLIFASRLRRWQQPQLAVRAEFLSLALGTILTLLSVANPHVRSLNLLLSTLTLAVITRKRSNLGRWLIYLTHVVGLAAVASGINLFFPSLTPRAWASVLILGMVAEWGFSVGSNWLLWRRSAWHFGLVMAALSYTLLFGGLNDSTSNLMWLATPVTLSWLASRRHFPHSQLSAWLSVVASGIVQPLICGLATPRLIGLGLATVLMLLNTQRLQHLAAAILTVGFGLSFIGAVIWQVAGQITPDLGINLLAIATLALWLLQSWLKRNSTALTEIYAVATDGWAIAISGFNLIGLTAYDLNIYITPLPASWKFILAAAITTFAIGYRNWRQSSNLGFYSLAWGLELLVAGAIALTSRSLTGLAIAEFVLGLTAQLAGDLWTQRRSGDPPSSWHVIPLIYAGLELVLSHITFTASTGLYTLGAVLIGIGVGRRYSSFKPLTYLAVFGVSAAAYELLIYHLLQTKGEEAGDGILLMAMLGIAIAVGVRLLSRWLVPYLRLTRRELKAIAHFHWVGSSGLLLLALLSSLSPSGELRWIAVAAVVAAYALVQGRSDEIWTYAGVVEAAGAVGYLLHRTVSDSILVGWSAVIACVFAYGMAVLPWEAWGWSAKPWRRSATVLPGAVVLITSGGIALQSLLLVAAFYTWRAIKTGIRLSYISMLLTDWAILRLLNEHGVTEPLWYATVLGGSLLYIAQVDPYLRSQPEREKRHLLRSLATGLICFTALYQSEAKFLLGLLTIGLSIMVILAGLALRTRAFLYVGTATFIIKVLRQLWLFINDYSLLLWAIGIVLGLAFIWIAATFEARRSQVMALVQYWMTELEAWE